MAVHRIRLRRPWEIDGQPPRVCFTRRFNCPTGLGPNERVWVVVEDLAGQGVMHFNGTPLGRLVPGPGPQRFEITGRLGPHNRLALVLEWPESPAGVEGEPPGRVRLEIESRQP